MIFIIAEMRKDGLKLNIFNLQDTIWPAVAVAVLSVVALMLTLVMLRMGYTSVFQNFYYFPIIMACVFFRKKGFYLSLALVLIYLLFMIYMAGGTETIIVAVIRALAFVLVAGVIYYLAEMRNRTWTLLEQNRNEYKDLVANFKGVIFRFSLNSKKKAEYVNDHIDKLTGFKPAEFLDHTIEMENIIHPDDIHHYNQTINHSVHKGNPWQVDYRIITRDGIIKWVHEKGNVQKDKSTNTHILDGVIFDISHTRKNVEDTRLEAMDASLDAIAVLDKNQKFLYVNDAYVALHGYSDSAEMLSLDWRELYPRDEANRFDKNILPHLRTTNRWRGEANARKMDGSIFSQELSLSVTKSGNTVCIARDISQRLEKQKQGKEFDITRRTLVFKQNFLANMSHEMRTPLTGILGMTDVLQQTATDPRQLEYIRDLQNCALTLSNMVDQVLDFTRIEQAEITINPCIFSLYSLLDNIGNSYKNQCESRSIELLVVKDKLLPDMIHADKSRIAQVLNILMSNAIKFTPHGTIALKARLYDMLEDSKQFILFFEVSDTGIGILEEDQGNIFEPFSHLHQDDRRAYDGAGLGLPIAKEIVSLHGGEIGLISTVGEGSTFWFTLIADNPN